MSNIRMRLMGWWPFVLKSSYNELVDERNSIKAELDTTALARRKIQETADTHYRTVVQQNNEIERMKAEIEGLKSQVKELENRPQPEMPKTYESEFKFLTEKVREYNKATFSAGQLFIALSNLWQNRINNSKAGPKAMAENKEEITKLFSDVREAWPKQIGEDILAK